MESSHALPGVQLSWCHEANAAYAAAIAVAIETGDPQRTYQAALGATREAAVREVLFRASAEPPADYSHLEGWVLIALQSAFFQLLRASSLEAALIETVSAGGDTDTNGAIAGALLGAVHGREAIPQRWRAALLSCRPLVEAGARKPRPRDFWPVDALELAEQLLACAIVSVRSIGGTQE